MIVEQIFTDNAYRNFNYLIACPRSGEALAIDPLESQLCLDRARDKGWEITQVLNTHEHGDHTGGNAAVIAATGAKLLAHAGAKDTIPGIDVGLKAGDTVKVGTAVEIEVLDTPGHTRSHVCLRGHDETPALLCGDTLFNAGAGNCHSGGHPALLYQTFAEQLASLPDETRIYPGHDYIANNLRFTSTASPTTRPRERFWPRSRPRTRTRRWSRPSASRRRSTPSSVWSAPSVIARLREDFPDLEEKPSPKQVFLKLRELRNSW